MFWILSGTFVKRILFAVPLRVSSSWLGVSPGGRRPAAGFLSVSPRLLGSAGATQHAGRHTALEDDWGKNESVLQTNCLDEKLVLRAAVWSPAGIWKRRGSVRRSVVCRARGNNPLVWGGRPTRGGVHRGHHSGKKLRAIVSLSLQHYSGLKNSEELYHGNIHRKFPHRSVEITTDESRSLPSEDFVSSYYVAFSNDSRDWTTLHDGYAEWVSGIKQYR